MYHPGHASRSCGRLDRSTRAHRPGEMSPCHTPQSSHIGEARQCVCMAPRATAWVCVGNVCGQKARGSQRDSFEPCWAAGDDSFGSLCSFAKRAQKHTPPRNRVGMGLRARAGEVPCRGSQRARQGKVKRKDPASQGAQGAEPPPCRAQPLGTHQPTEVRLEGTMHM